MKASPAYWIKLLGTNLALLLAMVVLALVCVEGYLRATIPSSSGGGLFESTRKTRRYKIMKPEARIIAWGSELRTNEHGFRDDDSQIPPKRAGSYRIVVLGDSFTVAAGVDFPKIFTSLLEKALSRTADVEVINLAVGGYNVIQYELVLDEVAFQFQPDLILTAVFPFNDLSNETYQANYEDAMGLSKPPPKPGWHQELYVYRAYLVRVEARIRRMLQPPAPDSDASSGSGQRGLSLEAQQNLAALKRIMEKAAARRVDAAVALLPNTDVFQAQHGDFAPFVALCSEHRWTCVNLLDRFESSAVDPASLRLNVIDPHPNERYNELTAGFLSESLRPIIERRLGAPPSDVSATPVS